jgi:arylsulfatase A-like enzyme
LPIASWDVLPTLAEVAGESVPTGLDGVSFAAALRGGSVSGSADRVFYWEFHEGGFNRAIRFGDWKAIQFGKDGDIELYDLKSDRGERTNLAKSKPDVIATAKAHFANARTDSKDFPVQAGVARSPDRGARVQ